MPRPPKTDTYTTEELAYFAEWREQRARIKPDECDDGTLCWVRDGPPACHPTRARCIGCNGWIKELAPRPPRGPAPKKFKRTQ